MVGLGWWLNKSHSYIIKWRYCVVLDGFCLELLLFFFLHARVIFLMDGRIYIKVGGGGGGVYKYIYNMYILFVFWNYIYLDGKLPLAFYIIDYFFTKLKHQLFAVFVWFVFFFFEFFKKTLTPRIPLLSFNKKLILKINPNIGATLYLIPQIP